MRQSQKAAVENQEREVAKKDYASPALTPLGRVEELTQSGSASARENKPHPGPDRRA